MNGNRILQIALWAGVLGLVVLFGSRFAGAAARRIPA